MKKTPQVIFETEYTLTTVGKLISILEKYPKDLIFAYIPDKPKKFEIIEFFGNLKLFYDPTIPREVMGLALRPKKDDMEQENN